MASKTPEMRLSAALSWARTEVPKQSRARSGKMAFMVVLKEANH
jgi:hypothetical protein